MKAPEAAMPWESDAISQRAALYFQQRRFWEWSEADQAELDLWLAQSPLHRAAYLRLEGIAAHTEHLVAFCPLEFGLGAQPAAAKPARRRFLLPLLVAASVVLCAAVGIPLAGYLMQPPDRAFSTDVGGRTLLKFVDGTEIELNTDTAMRFRITGEERTVWLDRGEAWFRVSHNAANPFAVVVGNHRITDLGTEFFIRRDPEDMEVALLAGRAMLNTEGTPAAMLTPGDDAIATPVSVSVTHKTQQHLADELAWRRGLLVFRKTRLADVVREFNRYNQTRLVIADPSIADVKITADLKTGDYESFLQLAQAVLNLRADREGNDILIFRSTGKSGRHAP